MEWTKSSLSPSLLIGIPPQERWNERIRESSVRRSKLKSVAFLDWWFYNDLYQFVSSVCIPTQERGNEIFWQIGKEYYNWLRKSRRDDIIIEDHIKAETKSRRDDIIIENSDQLNDFNPFILEIIKQDKVHFER